MKRNRNAVIVSKINLFLVYIKEIIMNIFSKYLFS
jgi:hypothetical protein